MPRTPDLTDDDVAFFQHWGLYMARKTYLTESEIVKLENMKEDERTAFFIAMGADKAEEYLSALLRSYRIVALVANVAWKLMKELENGEPQQETIVALQRTLHLYSPGNFPPSPLDVAYGLQLLEETYNFLSQWSHPSMGPVVLDKLWECIQTRRGELVGMHAPA